MLLLMFFVLFLLEVQILIAQEYCGEPGRTDVAFPNAKYLLTNKSYPAGYEVFYECEDELKGIDFHDRVCESGQWIEQIPKCGTFIKTFNLKYIY